MEMEMGHARVPDVQAPPDNTWRRGHGTNWSSWHRYNFRMNVLFFSLIPTIGLGTLRTSTNSVSDDAECPRRSCAIHLQRLHHDCSQSHGSRGRLDSSRRFSAGTFLSRG